jgi:hypothetical protein
MDKSRPKEGSAAGFKLFRGFSKFIFKQLPNSLRFMRMPIAYVNPHFSQPTLFTCEVQLPNNTKLSGLLLVSYLSEV